jgi:hypothetical protein
MGGAASEQLSSFLPEPPDVEATRRAQSRSPRPKRALFDCLAEPAGYRSIFVERASCIALRIEPFQKTFGDETRANPPHRLFRRPGFLSRSSASPFVLGERQGLPNEYRDVRRYSTPEGLNLIMR